MFTSGLLAYLHIDFGLEIEIGGHPAFMTCLLGRSTAVWGLFVMRKDGTHVEQLTDNQWEEGTPAWQPEGVRLSAWIR